MGIRRVVALWLTVSMIGCKARGSEPVQTIDPGSGYARIRPGIVKGVTNFPADPASLARCDPGLGRVMMLSLADAARVLKIPLPRPQAAFSFAPFTTYAAEHMGHIEGHDMADNDLGWFDQAKRFGLFSTVVAIQPTMTDCKPTQDSKPGYIKQSECSLTPGVVDGSVVVFDDSGHPTCAVKVRIDGPYWVGGSRGVAGDMSTAVQETLEALFDARARPTEPPARRFLSKLSPRPGYKITVGDVVMVEPTR